MCVTDLRRDWEQSWGGGVEDSGDSTAQVGEGKARWSGI